MPDKNDLIVFVKSQLLTEDKEKVKQFLRSVDNFSILQYPGWADTTIEKRKKHEYFIALEQDKIVGFALVLVILNKIVRISFGPITQNKETAVKLIEFIIEHFKKNKIARLDIQYGLGVSNDATYVQYKIASRYKTSFYYGVKNKSTLLLDLSAAEETIFRNFSKGHKSALKKAAKANIHVKLISCLNEYEKYVEGYINMYQLRKLVINAKETKKRFYEYFELIIKDHLGFVLGAYNEENKLIGGCTIVYQKNTALYFNGFSDQELRDLPISHLTLFESIRKAKIEGKTFFDFGGYNFFVKPGDQVYNINIFKKGFCSDSFYFFPPIMQIHLKPFQSKVLSLLEKVKSRQ